MPSLNFQRFVERLRRAPAPPFIMRDWPETWRLQVAALRLAQDVYAARLQTFGGGAPDWLNLPPARKQRFVDVAADAIRDERLGR